MQPGGSQYGVPPSDQLNQYAPSGAAGGGRGQMLGISGPEPLAEAAPPISSRPPANFGDLGPGGSGVGGGFADDDALAAGEEAERGGAPGNRWPRQETLALLKIRSEMDAAFRDATLKGPLWEDVSRKLAELGYTRSAKKCKEKFENVHKYYKRTKEGRAGRQDGKSYRFFSQLEALHSQHGSSSAAAPMNTAVPAVPTTSLPPARIQQPSPISAAPPLPLTSAHSRAAPDLTPATAAAAAGISFSSNTSSSSSEESDDEETEEGAGEGRKRKRGASGGGGSRKMMAFFEGLMKQVMERQESMQQRFLETIEKREQDRMIREEAWRRQEMARLSREHELMAQERAMAASRDAAVIAFLQKITGQTVPLPPAPAPPPQPSPQPPPPPQHPQPLQSTPPPQKPPQHHVSSTPTDVARHQVSSSSELIVLPDPHETPGGSGGFEPGTSSSRWPKSEVHALIKIRSGLDARYQEAGPKGPLWEEISGEMQKLGYNRSSKRCKEKWENINKYFKKVKESNKKRPEDAKTCPYFHQLDALYRKKLLTSSASGSTSAAASGAAGGVAMLEAAPAPNPQDRSDVVLPIMPPPAAPSPQRESDTKPGSSGRSGGIAEGGGSSSNNNNNNSGSNTASIQIQTSNGGLPPSFFDEGAGSGSTMKKPEDIMKELMEQQHNQAVMDDYDDKLEEPDSDNIDHDDDDDDDDDEDRKLQYKIQFQRPNVGTGATNTSNSSAKTGATSAGSFLAMVQ